MADFKINLGHKLISFCILLLIFCFLSAFGGGKVFAQCKLSSPAVTVPSGGGYCVLHSYNGSGNQCTTTTSFEICEGTTFVSGTCTVSGTECAYDGGYNHVGCYCTAAGCGSICAAGSPPPTNACTAATGTCAASAPSSSCTKSTVAAQNAACQPPAADDCYICPAAGGPGPGGPGAPPAAPPACLSAGCPKCQPYQTWDATAQKCLQGTYHDENGGYESYSYVDPACDPCDQNQNCIIGCGCITSTESYNYDPTTCSQITPGVNNLPDCIVNHKACPTAIGFIDPDFGAFVEKLFSVLLLLGGGISLLLIIISGYRLIVSQGNPEAVQNARNQLAAAIVGLLFIIFSLVILQAIGYDILHIPGINP